jgi:hypothetical protein
MGKKDLENATGHPLMSKGGGKRQLAIGTPAAWAQELCRIQVALPDSTFVEVKMSAMRNNRSLSMEVRTMVEDAVRAQIAKRNEDS